MSCRLVKRYVGGSTSFNGSTSVINVASPVTLPTSGYAVSFRYKASIRGALKTTGNVFGNNQGWMFRTGSIYYGRQATNDCQVYAYLDAPNDFATPRRLRFRNFYMPNGDGQWHHRALNFYVENGSAKCDEYEDGAKLGATHTVDYTEDANTPSGNLVIGGNGIQSFQGLMAEVRFYPTLTAEQIKQIAITGSCGVAPLQSHALDDLPSTYLDTIGGATGTGTATTYSPDVPVQLPVMVDGGARSSLLFTGAGASGSNITVPDDASIKFTGSFTLSGEVKSGLTPGNDNPRLYSKFPNYYAYKRSATSSDLYVRVFDGITLSIDSLYIPNVFINQWVKWAFKFDTVNRVAYGYRNGLLVGKQSFPASFDPFLITSTQDLKIGCAEFSSISLLGNQKSFRIWNTALTDQQIRDLHFNNIVPTEGLVLNLELNEGAGTTAYDSSGNGNDGTITGATWSAVVPSKAREVIGGNLVKNGDFSYVPRVNVATTASNVWIDGTALGSSSDLPVSNFKWGLNASGTFSALFDTSEPEGNKNALKLSTDATGSWVEALLWKGTTSQAKVRTYGIKVLPNTKYTCSYKMKTQYISGDATNGARLAIDERNTIGGAVATQGTTYVKTTTEYTTYTFSFITGTTTRYVTPRALIYGHQGTATLLMNAWFKDITLDRYDSQTRSTVERLNLSFGGELMSATGTLQGVTTDGTYIYTTVSTTVYKYNKDGSLVTSRNISGDSANTSVHTGDLCYYNGFLYIGGGSSLEVGGVLKLNASDLSLDSAIATEGNHECASIARNPSTGDFWIVSYKGVGAGGKQKIYQYDSSFTYQAVFDLQDVGSDIGLAYDGIEWISSGSTWYLLANVHESSENNEYIDVYSFDGSLFTRIQRVSHTVNGYELGQGIALDPANDNVLWMCSRSSTQIYKMYVSFPSARTTVTC